MAGFSSSVPPKQFDILAMEPNIKNGVCSASLAADATFDMVTINGSGMLTDLRFATGNQYGIVELVVDGTVIPLQSNGSGLSDNKRVILGYVNQQSATGLFWQGYANSSKVAFKSSLIVRVRNIATSSTTMDACVTVAYLTPS